MTKESKGAPDGRAVVNGAASVSAVPASIPSALSEQAGTISISGSVVRVDCDSRAEAEQLFEWLLDTQSDQGPKGQDPQGLDAKHASGVAEGDAP